MPNTNKDENAITVNEIDTNSLVGLAEAYTSLIQAISEDRSTKPSKFKESLASLDVFRYEELPSIVASRQVEKHGYLDLNELKRLLEWKMSRGIFRPALRGLVASNDEKTVREITAKAFAALSDSSGKYRDIADVKKAMKTLCQLRGVGPATASLLLSVAFSEDIPFFGDELYAWVSASNQRKLDDLIEQVHPKASSNKGQRVDKVAGIKYTDAEYKIIYEAVMQLRERSDQDSHKTSATDIERIAFVLIHSRSALCLEDHKLKPSQGLQQATEDVSSHKFTKKKRKVLLKERGNEQISTTNNHLQAGTKANEPRRSNRLTTMDASETIETPANKRRKTRKTS